MRKLSPTFSNPHQYITNVNSPTSMSRFFLQLVKYLIVVSLTKLNHLLFISNNSITLFVVTFLARMRQISILNKLK